MTEAPRHRPSCSCWLSSSPDSRCCMLRSRAAAQQTPLVAPFISENQPLHLPCRSWMSLGARCAQWATRVLKLQGHSLKWQCCWYRYSSCTSHSACMYNKQLHLPI